MEINLTVQPSTQMECSGAIEDDVIRMSEVYRNILNLSVGNKMCLKYKNGATKDFQVSFAYKNDLMSPWSAYLTQNNFDSIKLNKSNPLTIGCDPEFFLINTMTYKISNAMNHFSFNSNVGNDGIVAEFRPQYSDNEDIVANNIMYLINKARHKLNNSINGKNLMLSSMRLKI